MVMADSRKRAHIFYSGRVQGVGFRYAAQDIAMNLGITGWIKNLDDGRVEVVVEGTEEDIKKFLDNISKGALGRYIKEVVLSWEKPAREFNDFDIRF